MANCFSIKGLSYFPHNIYIIFFLSTPPSLLPDWSCVYAGSTCKRTWAESKCDRLSPDCIRFVSIRHFFGSLEAPDCFLTKHRHWPYNQDCYHTTARVQSARLASTTRGPGHALPRPGDTLRKRKLPLLGA